MTIANPLISTQASSGTSFEVALHPLALLSISDYITRHTLRQQTGPIIGALLGQQNGRQVSIENAFECLVTEVDGETLLNKSWFDERMQQMKDVHKSPVLDIVGWYTTLPLTGPQPVHLPIHLQILQNYNESALLLGFYPSLVTDRSNSGKLPLAIFESNFEAEDKESGNGDDKTRKENDLKPSIKFKEILFSIETGEAEMISVDSVARSGGNATAAIGTETSFKVSSKEKGSRQDCRTEASIEGKNEKTSTEDRGLSREEEELLASLTAKINAIKMLHARVNLMISFLKEVQYSDGANKLDDQENRSAKHVVLRSIQALLSRLSLLVPENAACYKQELISEHNDVNLVSLLSTLTETMKDIREVGVKHGVIESTKIIKSKSSNQWSGSSQRGVSGVGDLLS